MGNSGSNNSSQYDCGDKVQFSGSYWSLYNGSKKESGAAVEDKDKHVSIFTLTKPANATPVVSVEEILFPIGSRGVQKLKAIKHPNILTYVDCLITAPTPASTAATTEQNYLMLITEPVVPLSQWLSVRLKQVVTADSDGNECINLTELQLLLNEVLWGFKCVLHAVRFLHDQMKCSHNYVMLPDGADSGAKFTSIYVNRFTGEWKLGNMEFCCAAGSADDEAFLARMQRHQPALSMSRGGGVAPAQFEPSAGRDVQQLGALLTAVYGRIDDALAGAAARREVCAQLGVGRGGVPTALITTLKKMTAVGGKAGGPSISADSVLRNCAMLRPVVPSGSEGTVGGASTNVIYLMEFLGELPQRIVPTLEALSFLQLLVDLAAVDPHPLPGEDPAAKARVGLHGLLSAPAINHRVVPLIGIMFQYCIVEYSNRNTRELYRQAMQVALLVLSALMSPRNSSVPGTKVTLATFHRAVLPYYAQLFCINDRLIRTSLLKSVKDVQVPAQEGVGALFLTEEFVNNKQKVSLTISSVTTAHTTPANATMSLTAVVPDPAAALVCNAVIDSVVLGFNDSSAKMREDTLKGLVPLLPHLNAANLNEKLALKYLVNLQQCETEAAIRTNCVILIGKIAHMLNDATRQRVLVTCLVKAVRDPFVHCRVAGLRTIQACMELLLDLTPASPAAQASLAGANNVLTKLVPAMAGMLLDSNVNMATTPVLAPAVLAAHAGTPAGGRGNPFRDERELALACIEAVMARVGEYHRNVLTPYENHQMANSAPSAPAPAPGAGARPPQAQQSPSRVANLAASAAAAPAPPRPQGPAAVGPASLIPSQAPASPGLGAAPGSGGGGSWLGSLTDSLNRTLESATGAADAAGNVQRSAEINAQRLQSQGSSGAVSKSGSASSMESLAIGKAPAPAVSVSVSSTNAWDDDDFGDMEDDLPAKVSSLGAKPAAPPASIGKANAWDDDDDDDDFGDMDDEPAPAPKPVVPAAAPVVGRLGVPAAKPAPSRLSVSATALAPKGPVSAHDLGASLGAAAGPAAPDDTDVQSVSMDDFLSGEGGSPSPKAQAAPAKGLTLGGLSTISRPPAVAKPGMGLAVPVRAAAAPSTGPVSRPTTGTVKKIGVIKKITKDSSKPKDDDWADF